MSTDWRSCLHPRYEAGPGAPGAAGETEWVAASARAQIDWLRARLDAAYGWTRLDARVQVDPAHRRLAVVGHAVLPAVARRLARGLRACVGSRWRVGVSLDTLAEQASWHAPRAGLTRLWRAHPERRLELATEWLPSDGPLSVLAHVRGAWLLRAADGSAGWTHDEPERARTSAPPAGRAVGQDWAAAARAFLGVPYRFGGTMGDGVDCSGLVQRLHRQVRGAVLPRHSRDQLVSRGRSRPQRSGDIVSLAAHADGAHHVGLALWTPRAGWSVVHASTTRGRVVEEALEDYLGAGQPEVE